MRMRVRALLAALVVVAVAGWIAAPGFTEDEPAGGAPAGGGESPWEILAKRGDQHVWMSFLIGSWNADAKFWVGPGDPVVSTGTMESYWKFGRRYVRSDYTGQWDGKTILGEATMGFDNISSKFMTTWIDTMGTGMSRGTGTREGDVITLTGKISMPMMGEVPFRTVYTKLSHDSYKMEEFWAIEGEGEMKVIDITYTRSKE